MAGVKTAAFALQNIHFSNVRYWRKADIPVLPARMAIIADAHSPCHGGGDMQPAQRAREGQLPSWKSGRNRGPAA